LPSFGICPCRIYWRGATSGKSIQERATRAVFPLMPTLHVVLKREDLSPVNLADKVVIVLDILFATSTMAHALSKGVTAIWPALNAEDANVVAERVGDCIKSGEYLAEHLPGFAPAMPLLLGREALQGRTLVYSTTNGTVALRAAAGAASAYIGALLNGAAVAAHVVRNHPDSQVLVVCSGSMGNFNLEDFYGAGHYVDHFQNLTGGRYELNDAARGARLLRTAHEPREVLMSSRVGLMMQPKGMSHEVEYCAQFDILNVVAGLQKDGALRKL
jgi:2-phosphosulfolactate phosphatase